MTPEELDELAFLFRAGVLPSQERCERLVASVHEAWAEQSRQHAMGVATGRLAGLEEAANVLDELADEHGAEMRWAARRIRGHGLPPCECSHDYADHEAWCLIADCECESFRARSGGAGP